MAERRHGRSRRPLRSPPPHPVPADAIDLLRGAASAEDDDGNPIGAPQGVDPTRPVGPGNPPRQQRKANAVPRPSRLEIERRVAQAQLWIAQRLPVVQIQENTGSSWRVTNSLTVHRYLNLARERMVQELISDRRRHQAEQIFALKRTPPTARPSASCSSARCRG
jgi:hypothetical protein